MKKSKILLLFLCLTFFRTYSENLSFYHLSVPEGLSQLSVLSLYQDELNNIWMGTFAGVNKYDGQNFSCYTPHDTHQTPILGNEITAISGNHAGKVFLLSENGISVIKIKNNEIVNVPQSDISAIKMGKKHLWVAVGNVLHFLTPRNQLIRSNIQSPVNEPITAILEHSSGSIWLGSNSGCYIIYPDKSTYYIKSCPLVTALYEDRTGKIWIGTSNNGTMLVDKERNIKMVLNRTNGLSNNFVRCIVEDKLGVVWMGTFAGLNRYDPRTKQINNYTNSPFNQFSISHNSVYSLLIDHQQTLWVGTYYGGVNYVNTNGTLMKYFNLFDEQKKDYNPVMAGCIREDLLHKIWIATDGAGLKSLDLNTGVIQSYTERFGETNYYNNIKSIFVDKDNSLWIGVHLNGLYHFDGKKFAYKPIFISKEIDHYNANIVNDILSMGEDTLLLATHDGVICFNKRNNKSEYLFNKTLHEKSGKKVSTIFLDTKQRLWIGTKGQGLSMYNLRTGAFSKYRFYNGEQPSDREAHKISSNHITQIQEDNSGKIWVATYGGGLNNYNEQKNDFSLCYAHIKGLHKYLQSLSPLNDSILLLGVKSGIAFYNKHTDKIDMEITKGSGFPLEELLDRSLCVTSDHQILVGGKRGIVQLKAKGLSDLHPNSPISFSQLFVNNKEILPGENNGILINTLPFTKSIVLKHKESSFGINIATHNYLKQLPEELEYRLDGYEQDWRKLNFNQTVYYNDIASGKYRLKVRYKNNPTAEVFLDITILAPWYLSWWAFTIYFIIIILLIAFVNKLFKTRKQLTIAEYEKQKIKVINQQKLDFFTNVSHEFRTPLTLIIGQIDNIINGVKIPPSVFRQIQQVHANASKLQTLITELLDFRKQEQGHLKLNVYEIDFDNFIRQIYTTFFEYAQHKQIRYDFRIEGPSVKIWIDPVQMEKVFYNLLSNAFKFTPSGGTIEVICRYADNEIAVEIKDTGCGIKKTDLDKIFNRFYQSEESYNAIPGTTGTGIGLSLVRSIVSLHHSNISVDSEPEKGSVFTVTLQYGNRQFDSGDLKYEAWQTPGESVQTWMSESTETLSAGHDINADIQISGDVPRILIVEDNPELCTFLEELFSPIYSVVTAQNGMEGLQKAKEFQPDLIVSDVMMPVMTGTEMCLNIKTHIDTSHIPVILLTAKTAMEYMVNGLQNGADDYICKPFNSRLLLLRCANLINSRRILQQKYSNGNVSYAQSINALATTQLDKEFAKKTETVLNENFHRSDFDVVALAYEMCMSRTGLFNKVKAIMGVTPLELINNFRLEKSKELMITYPDKPLIDIVEMVGFTSAKYFAKCFKDHFGISIGEFRKKPL